MTAQPSTTPPPTPAEDPPDPSYPRLFAVITLLFIGLFVWYWGGIAHDYYQATTKKPFVIKPTDVWIAGILATTLASGVAAALGVEIAKIDAIKATATGGRLRLLSWLVTAIKWVWQATTVKVVVAIGILAYLVIGAYMIIAMRHSPIETPDFIKTMVTSVAGLFVGVVGVTFRSAAKK
jgi:hypothetical protein